MGTPHLPGKDQAARGSGRFLEMEKTKGVGPGNRRLSHIDPSAVKGVLFEIERYISISFFISLVWDAV